MSLLLLQGVNTRPWVNNTKIHKMRIILNLMRWAEIVRANCFKLKMLSHSSFTSQPVCLYLYLTVCIVFNNFSQFYNCLAVDRSDLSFLNYVIFYLKKFNWLVSYCTALQRNKNIKQKMLNDISTFLKILNWCKEWVDILPQWNLIIVSWSYLLSFQIL